MYWPVGAPRIYAASNSRTTRKRVVESDDDAESRETTEGTGSVKGDAPSNGSGGRSDYSLEPISGTSTPVTPMTPGIKPVEQDNQRPLSARLLEHDSSVPGRASELAGREPILALRVSRTGHLFAVITSTSLTIWQTKVCYPSLWYQHF
jgi:hypothetical protein